MIMADLRFFYNGIKAPEHKFVLQTCWYSMAYQSSGLEYPEGTITIYAREYCYGAYPHRWVGFSAEIRNAFLVENDSDILSDYSEKDRIHVTPAHPLYPQVKAAFDAAEEKAKVRNDKRLALIQGE